MSRKKIDFPIVVSPNDTKSHQQTTDEQNWLIAQDAH